MRRDRVRFHPETARELAEILDWYGARDPRLREEFKAAVDEAIRWISIAPQRWPLTVGEHRRILVRRFPYAIFYLVSGSAVWVIAFAHTSREPGYWLGRRIPGEE